jgi:hypothetical protein
MYVISSTPMFEAANFLIDIPTNAEREGYHNLYAAEKIPNHVRLYTPAFSWARSLELCVTSAIRLARFQTRLSSADNIGLMPYRRRIVAVSK